MLRNASGVFFSGWALMAWLSLCVVAICVAGLAISSEPVEGARMVIRLTARTSLVLFLLAFTASSLAALFRAPLTEWLLTNRRYLGLAFAFSHGVHAAGIIVLSKIDPQLFDQLTSPVTFIAGGFGYAVILALAITSFDQAVALIGARRWRALHTGGVWLIAVFFAINFGRRAVMMPAMYWPYMVLIFVAMALRFATDRRRAKVPAVTGRR
ncbi:ferric reductase-like transmembrane domain-containing protein [Oryzibacter oryziterrae]|uniref:ferric reductase-like transmembrane domain-containing protein n=1 Tax=Oryzibacter oryziterrae TaxID=2766474 RepID=UPI001F3FCA5F|nr:ferric reductase-like transmembrane domain-containing protein [Oryzibacter oryziterrae]